MVAPYIKIIYLKSIPFIHVYTFIMASTNTSILLRNGTVTIQIDSKSEGQADIIPLYNHS